MKILITTDLYTKSTNGVVTSVKNLYDELIKSGHDVRILTLSESTKSRKDGDIYYIRSMPIGVYPDVRMPLSYRHRLIKELIAWSPDIIHSQCEFFTFQYALHISKHTDAPIIHTYHTMYEHYVTYVLPSKRLGKWVIKHFLKNRLKKVNTVIVPTNKIEDNLNSYGMDKNLCVIPSGISLDQHQKRITPEEREKKRQELGISNDQQALINLGRLGNEKNLDELLQFFAEAVNDKDDLVLLIVGDGPAREQLEKQAEKLRIDDKVIFTGMVDPTDVQKYYQLGDVFVSASTSETQGLTYIEAAANGLPLLCRQDECLDDVIVEGENGYEYTSKEEFLKALFEIIENSEWRATAGKKREEIVSKFDKKVFGDTVEKVYADEIKNNEAE